MIWHAYDPTGLAPVVMNVEIRAVSVEKRLPPPG